MTNNSIGLWTRCLTCGGYGGFDTPKRLCHDCKGHGGSHRYRGSAS